MKQLFKITILLLFISTTQISFAQTSNLSIQGILRTADGSAVEDGNYQVTFKLYLQANTGNPIWEETIENVPVSGGIYSVILGGGDTPLDAAFDQPYFLGVTIGDIGTAIELTPRARLTSSPYALSLIGDDNIFPNSGNVGVGSADPQNKLTVQRGNGVLGLDAIEDADNTSTITSTATGMRFNAGGNDKVYQFEAGDVEIGEGNLKLNNGAFTFYDEANTPTDIASLGFEEDTLLLANAIGETKIEGNDITLNTSSGTATIEGHTVIEGNTTMNGNTTANGNIEVNKDGEALKLVGVDASYIAFYPKGVSGGQKSFIGYNSASVYGNNNLTFHNSQGGNMIFSIYGGNTTADYEFKDGRVIIRGYRALYFSESPDRAIRGNHAHWASVGNYNLGLKVDHDIGTRAVNLWSDKRIKKDFKLSNNKADLRLLQQVEVTDYRHIDEKTNGTGITKGLIAQQVASIYPAAVNKSRNAIPSVLAFPSEIKEEDGAQIIRLEKKHDLEVNNIVKILSDNNEEKVAVTRIIDPYTFVVELSEIKANENIFIYGKEVNDFHAVNYNKIFTLNVSATQELARQVEALKKENAILKAANAKTNHSNNELKAALNTLNSRVKDIEALLESNTIK